MLFKVTIQTTADGILPTRFLLSSPSLSATLPVTDCCIWSRSRRWYPTYSRLCPPYIRPQVLLSHAENAILLATLAVLPQLRQRAIPTTLLALLSLVTIRIPDSRPIQPLSPRSRRNVNPLKCKSQQSQSGRCRAGKRQKNRQRRNASLRDVCSRQRPHDSPEGMTVQT